MNDRVLHRARNGRDRLFGIRAAVLRHDFGRLIQISVVTILTRKPLQSLDRPSSRKPVARFMTVDAGDHSLSCNDFVKHVVTTAFSGRLIMQGRWQLLNPNADERRTNIQGTSSSCWPGENPAVMTTTVIACATVLNDTRRMTVDDADVAETECFGDT